MKDTPTGKIADHFSELEDPRRQNRRHLLIDIITIAICGAICGADGWSEIELFGQAKYNWFKQFLELPHGIPSHDTFGRVFGLIDAKQFQKRFIEWIKAIHELTQGQVVAVDGKKLRRSYDRGSDKDAIYVVSAWASENRLVLGQVKVDAKSNEITAIPQLLELLEISGCIVTTDAMGCQKDIGRQVIEKEADYVLDVKGNQEGLHTAIQELFDFEEEESFAECDYHKTVNKGHGRIEIRECWTTSAPDYLWYLPNLDRWEGLRSIVMLKSERQSNQGSTIEYRYFISSLESDAKQALYAARTHWSIENEVHWVLDVAFREDDSRVRTGNADQNLALLRRMALNLLKQETTLKRGIKAKRLKAGWDHDYLLKILAG